MLLAQSQAYREQYGFNAIFLLPTNLYGEGDNFHPRDSHVIPALIRKFTEAKRNGDGEVIVWGGGRATREFLYAGDAADGILLATERYESGEPVNLGSGQEIAMGDLAALIAELCEYKGRIAWDTAKPEGQQRRCLDTDRARGFGFEAKTNLRDGLERTIRWYYGVA